MKHLKDIITEKLRLDNSIKSLYTCYPKTKDELRDIIKERLSKDKNTNLNDIDVSQITSMNFLFNHLDPHNIKIDKWNVSNVETMYCMFKECENFNADLSKWDVSKLEDARYMFYECKSFNANLNMWDISSVKTMKYMFDECKSLKKLPKWYKE